MGVDTLSVDRKTAGVSRADAGSVTHVVLEGVKEFKTRFTGVTAKEGFPYIFVSPQRLKRIRERQKVGTWTPRSQIVNNLDRRFRLLRSKAGVDECVLHDLRRSAITNWAEKLPIQVVQQLAGHSDISTTGKYYLAVRSEDLPSASKLLNKLLAKAKCN
jgi:integrase